MQLSVKINSLGYYGPKGFRVSLKRRPGVFIYGHGPIAAVLNSPINHLGPLIKPALKETISLPARCVRSLASVFHSDINIELGPTTQATSISRQSWQEVLPNGVTLKFDLDPSAPYASANTIILGAGVICEPKGQEGIAHLIEHLIADKEGSGIKAATTSSHCTNYAIITNPERFELLLTGSLKEIFRPTFTSSFLQYCLNIVSVEAKSSLSSRRSLFLKAVFGEHPLIRDIFENPDNLSEPSLKDIKHFHQKTYLGGNTIIAVSGNFDPKQVRNIATSFIPCGENPFSMPIQATSSRLIIGSTNYQNPILRFFTPPLTGLSHKELAALIFLSFILGTEKSSLLYGIIRRTMKKTYGVLCNPWNILDHQFIEITIRPKEPKDIGEIIEAVLNTLSELCNQPISPYELEKHRGYVRDVLLNDFTKSPLDYFTSFVKSELEQTKRDLSILKIIHLLEEISSMDILAMARKILGPQNLRLVVETGNEETIDLLSQVKYPWSKNILFETQKTPPPTS